MFFYRCRCFFDRCWFSNLDIFDLFHIQNRFDGRSLFDNLFFFGFLGFDFLNVVDDLVDLHGNGIGEFIILIGRIQDSLFNRCLYRCYKRCHDRFFFNGRCLNLRFLVVSDLIDHVVGQLRNRHITFCHIVAADFIDRITDVGIGRSFIINCMVIDIFFDRCRCFNWCFFNRCLRIFFGNRRNRQIINEGIINDRCRRSCLFNGRCFNNRCSFFQSFDMVKIRCFD